MPFHIMTPSEPIIYDQGLAGVKRVNGSIRGMTAEETATAFSSIYAGLKSDIQRHALMRVPSSKVTDYDLYLGKTLVVKDTREYLPFTDSFFLKEGVNNKPFEKKKQAGLIVTSNFLAYDVKVYSEAPPIVQTTSLSNRYATRLASDVPGSFYKDGYFWLNSNFGVASGSMTLVRARYKEERGIYAPPVAYPAHDIFLSVADKLVQVDSGMVSKTLAEANTRYLDALTALAELPDTIKSVYEGFAMMSRLIVDVKTRNFNLTKEFQSRRKYLDKNLERELKRLFSRGPNSRSSKRMLERQKQRILDSHSRAVKRSVLEFNSAIAGVWLNFRYNIMPTVYLLEDIADVIDKIDAYFQTSRDFVQTDMSIQFQDLTLKGTHTMRAFIKYGFSPSETTFRKWSKQISANLFATAWELVPLSFVVDWFINVGDTLRTLSIPIDVQQKAYQFSNKLELAFDGLNDSYGTTRVTVACYNRRNINPYEHTGIIFNPDLSPVRQLDALALLWGPIRNALISSKHFK